MPGWQGSDRKSRLPPNWPALRKQRLELDHWKCRWIVNGRRCGEPATDVDHIVPNDDDSMNNLRSLCSAHHRHKSGQEGARGRARKLEAVREKYRKPESAHPSTYVSGVKRSWTN